MLSFYNILARIDDSVIAKQFSLVCVSTSVYLGALDLFLLLSKFESLAS